MIKFNKNQKILSQGKKFSLCYYGSMLPKRKKLTLIQKRKLLVFLKERDGYRCFYCKKEFKNVREIIIEHLNNDPSDNREDNLVLSHQRCNVLKNKQENKEYLSMAELKLEENENHLYVGENFLDEKLEQPKISKEIEISNKCYSITEKYLTDEILSKGWIDYKEALYSIVYQCRQQTGHGSEQQVRSHIYTLTSVVAPFEITKHPTTKKKIIKKRGSD